MPAAKYRVTVTPVPTREEVLALMEHLERFNEAHREGFAQDLLVVMLRDAEGGAVGGILGSHHWSWAHISHLWVPEHLRGDGWGTKLLKAFEKLARAQGCIGVHVDTFDFQARGFYEAAGYTCFGSIDDYPPGGALHFLSKRLAPAARGSST